MNVQKASVFSGTASRRAWTQQPSIVRCGGPRVRCQKATEPGKSNITEDMLQRLQAAEEEAARLRKQLAAAQAAKGAPAAEVSGTKPKRIDSTDSREVPFADKVERSSWLSEADVNFFIGDGAVERSPTASASVDVDSQATVQRRLLVGLALTAGALAFALVPTEALRLKPPKPLYFYIVPLLRIQDLLSECGPIIEDAQWEQLRVVLQRIQGAPNHVLTNLEDCVALLDDAAVRSKAQVLAQELNEYLDAMDYNSYFDAIPVRTITGAQNAEFVNFSRNALLVARSKLSQFLKLLPQTAIEQAQQAMVI